MTTAAAAAAGNPPVNSIAAVVAADKCRRRRRSPPPPVQERLGELLRRAIIICPKDSLHEAGALVDRPPRSLAEKVRLARLGRRIKTLTRRWRLGSSNLEDDDDDDDEPVVRKRKLPYDSLLWDEDERLDPVGNHRSFSMRGRRRSEDGSLSVSPAPFFSLSLSFLLLLFLLPLPKHNLSILSFFFVFFS